MRTARFFLLFTLLGMALVTSSAQNELTEEDKKELQDRVKIKVEELQQYLSDIVNIELSDN